MKKITDLKKIEKAWILANAGCCAIACTTGVYAIYKAVELYKSKSNGIRVLDEPCMLYAAAFVGLIFAALAYMALNKALDADLRQPSTPEQTTNNAPTAQQHILA